MLALRGPSPIPSSMVHVFLRLVSFLRSVRFLQCVQSCIENQTAPAKVISSWLGFAECGGEISLITLISLTQRRG